VIPFNSRTIWRCCVALSPRSRPPKSHAVQRSRGFVSLRGTLHDRSGRSGSTLSWISMRARTTVPIAVCCGA